MPFCTFSVFFIHILLSYASARKITFSHSTDAIQTYNFSHILILLRYSQTDGKYVVHSFVVHQNLGKTIKYCAFDRFRATAKLIQFREILQSLTEWSGEWINNLERFVSRVISGSPIFDLVWTAIVECAMHIFKYSFAGNSYSICQHEMLSHSTSNKDQRKIWRDRYFLLDTTNYELLIFSQRHGRAIQFHSLFREPPGINRMCKAMLIMALKMLSHIHLTNTFKPKTLNLI